MKEQETIFRQKSIDRISSPEQLDNYLKVTTPNVWIALIGIIIILIGAIVWGYYGRMKTYVNVGCVVSSNVSYCYVKEDDISKIEKGMDIEISDKAINSKVEVIGNAGVNIPDTYDYLQHLIGVTSSDYVFEVQGSCDLEDGYYQGKIVVESISPLKFIYN